MEESLLSYGQNDVTTIMPPPQLLVPPRHLSHPSTINSDSTVTEPLGLGSTTAPFLQSLGSFAIRRIDAYIVNRRLFDIQARFPHTDQESVPDDDYDSLIEVSRPDLSYDASSQRRALRLLSLQIKHRHVRQLIRRLLGTWQQEWREDLNELQMLLKELGRECFKPFGKSPHPEQELLSRRAFLDFCLQLCQVEIKVFDLVKEIVPHLVPVYNEHPLTSLCSEPTSGAPLSVLLYRYSPHLRNQLWHRLGPDYIEERLSSIQSYLKCVVPSPQYNEIVDACFDILQFCSSCNQNEFAGQAIDCFLLIITSIDKGVWWDTLFSVLAENVLREDLSNIVDLLLSNSTQIQLLYSSSSFLRISASSAQSAGVNIQQSFLSLILRTLSQGQRESFKRTLLGTNFGSLFLCYISQYIRPRISPETIRHSYQTVRAVLSMIAGESSLYYFPRNDPVLQTYKQTWVEVVEILGRNPVKYLPIIPAGPIMPVQTSHELHGAYRIPPSTSLATMMETKQSSTRVKSKLFEQTAKKVHEQQEFLRVASKLGLLSFPDSESQLDELPKDKKSYKQRKREGELIRVADQLGLI
ncbi:hypothetical protein C8R42DRAFT_776186 [Lentinula raphanica]|nr:hypothetical protein C8R42DRAFT_776186 [Lentinula raphanica]